MSELSDLSAAGQSEVAQIAQSLDRASDAAIRRSRLVTRVFLAMGVLIVAAVIGIQVYILRNVGQVAPAVARVDLSSPALLQELCPGDFLRYLLEINLSDAALVDVDASVAQVGNEQIVLFSKTKRAYYQAGGASILEVGWYLPRKIPAQGVEQALADSRGSSFWEDGLYARTITVTGVEGVFHAASAEIRFRIRGDCGNVSRRRDHEGVPDH